MAQRGTDAPWRIIDANENRAREGLRVMEDVARFHLDHRELVGAIKELRHGLAAALDPLDDGRRLTARDTPGDVGTEVRGSREYDRTGVRSVAVAAAKRTTEALRSIEEQAKALGRGGIAGAVESLRYRAYDVEKRLVQAMGSGHGRQWRLCVLITESLCLRPWMEVARGSLEGGADCLQLREKDLDDSELLARARSLVDLAGESGADVVVNDRVDIALAAGAAGVHLGQTDMPVEAVRRVAGFDLLVGVSTTDLEQAGAALRAGADVCGVGPMFASTTKQKPTLAGPAYLRGYLAHTPPLPPHLAIGGIDGRTIGELVEAGVRGVAVSAAVCGAEDPRAACAGIVGAMAGGRDDPDRRR